MPSIYELISHLKSCPADFLHASCEETDSKGIETNALILDSLRKTNTQYQTTSALKDPIYYKAITENHRRSIHIVAWLLSHPAFQQSAAGPQAIEELLFEQLKEMSRLVKYKDWVFNEDRTEELARTALFTCNILPGSETEEEAIDRLESLSSLKRNKILAKTKAAYDRAIEIRRKMAEKKAREAANVYGRE